MKSSFHLKKTHLSREPSGQNKVDHSPSTSECKKCGLFVIHEVRHSVRGCVGQLKLFRRIKSQGSVRDLDLMKT